MKDTDTFTIVCISHLEWTETLFQRPQQVALRLSERHKIIFVDELWLKDWVKGLFSKERKNSFWVNDNLLVYRPLMPLQTLNKKPRFFKYLNKWLVERRLKRMIKRDKTHKLILWFYFPKFLDIINGSNATKIVYECMDNYAALANNNKSCLEDIEDEESYLLDKADMIFYGAKTLMDSRPEFKHKSCHIPTGVDVGHFSKAMDKKSPVPHDIMHINKPILGYWGAVDERIDYRLLYYCATMGSKYSVVLIGPMIKIEEKDIEFLLNLPNVHWLGPKSYETLPDYARAFDICLLPFKLTDEGKYLNPTKTLEYLATGRPVVSTRIPDIEQFYSDTVSIAFDEEDFLIKIEDALSYDNEEKRKIRMEKTKGKSWEDMVRKMEKKVKEHIK